jgi:hypothetical protein
MHLTRHTAVHLGKSCGFVEGCDLEYKAGKAAGNNQGQMKSGNFEKQVHEKVIQNLATPPAIIMDNVPSHGK